MNISDVESATVTSHAKKKVFWKRVRKYLREYSDVTGIQGLRYVTEKRTRAEKVFWTIVLLVSLAGCVYMIHTIIVKFKTSPVVINFASSETSIFDIPFPAVTICPEVKYSRALFDYSDILNRLLSNRDRDSLNDEELRYFDYINLLCDSFFDDIGGNKTLDDDFFEVLNKLKPEFGTMVGYMGSPFYNFSTFIPVITDIGICYTFNMIDRSEIFKDHYAFYGSFYEVGSRSQYDGEYGYDDDAGVESYPRRALKSGIENSLYIWLFTNRSDNDPNCNHFFEGYRVKIHHPFDIPQFSTNYFRVPLDKDVAAAVVPQVIHTSGEVRNLKPEHRNCYFLNEKALNYFKIYTESNCLLECTANHILNKCGCVPFNMPRTNRTLFCGIGNEYCVNEAKHEVKLQQLKNKKSTRKKENQCDCKPLCTYVKYDFETAQGSFYRKKFFETFDADGTSSSVLNIYFKTEKFNTLERNVLYGVSDLISNFGGVLGLFTGFSLITIAEIIYFATVRIFYNRLLYGIWSGLPN